VHVHVVQLVITFSIIVTCCATCTTSAMATIQYYIPYSGYISGGEIFLSSEFLASSWKNYHGRSILNHTPVLCSTVSWVKISWFTSQPRKPRKFYPPQNTRYTVAIEKCMVAHRVHLRRLYPLRYLLRYLLRHPLRHPMLYTRMAAGTAAGAAAGTDAGTGSGYRSGTRGG